MHLLSIWISLVTFPFIDFALFSFILSSILVGWSFFLIDLQKLLVYQGQQFLLCRGYCSSFCESVIHLSLSLQYASAYRNFSSMCCPVCTSVSLWFWLFPQGGCLAANIIIKVITSSYVTVTTSRYCHTCFTGIHWLILLLTHLFSNAGTEAEGALSHQQMSVVGVGLQTQAGWHHLIHSFFSTFSPHLRLYSVRGVYGIL